jgi:hypothetical protein
MSENDNNWKMKVVVGSTILGAISGLAAGFLLSRSAEERGGVPPKIHTADALRLVVAVIGLVRGIAALGDPD